MTIGSLSGCNLSPPGPNNNSEAGLDKRSNDIIAAAEQETVDLRYKSFSFESLSAVNRQFDRVSARLVFGDPGSGGGVPVTAIFGMRSAGEDVIRAEGTYFPEQCRFDFSDIHLNDRDHSAIHIWERAFYPDPGPRNHFHGILGALSQEVRTKECNFDRIENKLTFKTADRENISAKATELYNFIIVVTDDQRFDTLWAMPIVQRELVQQGVKFENAYATVSLCCPWRASFLAGGFHAHETGVLSNAYPNGSALNFQDRNTLATTLYSKGYETALIGKYLNAYTRFAPMIPPGWTTFSAQVAGKAFPKKSWSDFFMVEGKSDYSRTEGAVRKVKFYTTQYAQSQAMNFVEETAGRPFFLYIATRAPHIPATPADQDRGKFPDFEYKERGYGEEDLSDKPQWVQEMIRERWPLDPEVEAKERPGARPWDPAKALRSLHAVDRLVGDLVQIIESRGIDDRTIIIFTSDGGELWGEHQIWGKVYHYEEALRVPLVIRYPGIGARRYDGLVANNLDLASTIISLAGGDNRNSGVDLTPILEGSNEPVREQIYSETFFEADSPRRQATAVTVKNDLGFWKYIEHYEGASELYNLNADPYELQSVHNDPQYSRIRDTLAQRLKQKKALGISVFNPPVANVGSPYEFQLRAEGGKKPYEWGYYSGGVFKPGTLPPGLDLNNETGLVSGVPKKPGKYRVMLRVKDASSSPQHGGAQIHHKWFIFTVED